MSDSHINQLLIRELPLFKDEINACKQANDLERLHNSVHRLVGGLEYCKEYKTLLLKAKTLYQNLLNKPKSFDLLNNDIDNLLIELDKETK